jgi:hypothetical protein
MEGAHTIERELRGGPVRADELVLQPVARVTGGYVSPPVAPGAQVIAGWLRVRPVEITVERGDHRYTVAVAEQADNPVLGLLLAALTVALVCTLIIASARRSTR